MLILLLVLKIFKGNPRKPKLLRAFRSNVNEKSFWVINRCRVEVQLGKTEKRTKAKKKDNVLEEGPLRKNPIPSFNVPSCLRYVRDTFCFRFELDNNLQWFIILLTPVSRRTKDLSLMQCITLCGLRRNFSRSQDDFGKN